MQLADLNWMDVERYLEQDDRIILITGATEQHAYLSLLTDIRIPQAIANAVAEREQVLVAPPLNFGCSAHFMEYPGTITLTAHTFDLVIAEVVSSLLQHGFSRFLVMNGHGGNVMPAVLEEYQAENAIAITWYNWWQGPAVQQIAAEIDATPGHANWLENFPFTRVADVPEGEKEFPVHDEQAIPRDVLGDGSYGGHYQMPDDLMLRLFNAVVEEAAALVRDL
jgi:creatinine amidohydrolase